MQGSLMHTLAGKSQEHAVPTKAGDVRRAAARWDVIYDRMPIAVYVCDIDGLMLAAGLASALQAKGAADIKR
jgi:hypothetical protein